MTVQKAGIAASLPFLLNPATVGLVAIGAVGWGLCQLLGDDEEVSEDVGPTSDVPQKSTEPFETDAGIAVQEAVCVDAGTEAFSDTCSDNEGETASKECNDEAKQREIVRQAMSELGKRSAAARARRKAAVSEPREPICSD